MAQSDAHQAADILHRCLDDLCSAEDDWNTYARTLTMKLHDKADDLGVDDFDDAPEAEQALTKENSALLTESQTADTASKKQEIEKRIAVLETKLAGVRDVRNAYDWIWADCRVVYREPTSLNARPEESRLQARIRGANLPEGEAREAESQMLAMAEAVSEKVASLREEVRKLQEMIDMLRDLDLNWDEAPLTRVLLSS